MHLMLVYYMASITSGEMATCNFHHLLRGTFVGQLFSVMNCLIYWKNIENGHQHTLFVLFLYFYEIKQIKEYMQLEKGIPIKLC